MGARERAARARKGGPGRFGSVPRDAKPTTRRGGGRGRAPISKAPTQFFFNPQTGKFSTQRISGAKAFTQAQAQQIESKGITSSQSRALQRGGSFEAVIKIKEPIKPRERGEVTRQLISIKKRVERIEKPKPKRKFFEIIPSVTAAPIPTTKPKKVIVERIKPRDRIGERAVKLKEKEERLFKLNQQLFRNIQPTSPERFRRLLAQKGNLFDKGRLIAVETVKTALRFPVRLTQIPLVVGGRIGLAFDALGTSTSRAELIKAGKKTLGIGPERSAIIEAFDPRQPEGVFNIILAGFAVRSVAINLRSGTNVKVSASSTRITRAPGNKVNFVRKGTARIGGEKVTFVQKVSNVSKAKANQLIRRVRVKLSGKEFRLLDKRIGLRKTIAKTQQRLRTAKGFKKKVIATRLKIEKTRLSRLAKKSEKIEIGRQIKLIKKPEVPTPTKLTKAQLKRLAKRKPSRKLARKIQRKEIRRRFQRDIKAEVKRAREIRGKVRARGRISKRQAELTERLKLRTLKRLKKGRISKVERTQEFNDYVKLIKRVVKGQKARGRIPTEFKDTVRQGFATLRKARELELKFLRRTSKIRVTKKSIPTNKKAFSTDTKQLNSATNNVINAINKAKTIKTRSGRQNLILKIKRDLQNIKKSVNKKAQAVNNKLAKGSKSASKKLELVLKQKTKLKPTKSLQELQMLVKLSASSAALAASSTLISILNRQADSVLIPLTIQEQKQAQTVAQARKQVQETVQEVEKVPVQEQPLVPVSKSLTRTILSTVFISGAVASKLLTGKFLPIGAAAGFQFPLRQGRFGRGSGFQQLASKRLIFISDLQSRIFGIRATKKEKRELLQVGRIFTGAEVRKL